MPVYSFECPDCSNQFQDLVTAGAKTYCKCGAVAVKQFSPTLNCIVPPNMRAENVNAPNEHKRWAESPEVRAKLDRGELIPGDPTDLKNL